MSLEMSKLSTKDIEGLHEALLGWYARNKRDLPWRSVQIKQESTPISVNNIAYAVWVSEIMLQQTRVESVKNYYTRWMNKFSNVSELAGASDAQVNSLWAGLGYYSRARNLHKAAKVVQEEYNGIIPSKLDDLLRLPGIGKYTAGAISSIAFDKPTPLVDGNVIRVFSRWFKKSLPRDDRKLTSFCWEVAEELVDTKVFLPFESFNLMNVVFSSLETGIKV